ncbi:ABC transporter permease subunit [Paenibacillus sp. PsM32]|uniref:ABC transporter permease subunit n=1 Tax=Paenibacillus sp. PsM32 TaxID=3030536 RepID=UPI00263A83F1|nr:ABC transporter permease subunit [Paenibacillus sp. PsM32]MDN4617304.1 ABC transporter permease subunit [Paenibacillus sp. PsM32]
MTTVIGMTWKELMRKKVVLMTLIMTVLFIIVFSFIARILGKTSDIEPSQQLVAQFMTGASILTLGFFFGSFILAFLIIFSSFSSISGEAEVSMMQSMLTRPIQRWKWYLGRWLGYTLFGIAYALVLYIAIVVIANIYATVPQSLVVHIQSFLLFALTVPLLVTVTLLGATFFSALGNGVFMTMLYGAGWLGGMVEKLSSSAELKPEMARSLYNITGMISLVMPADAIQRKMLAVILNVDQLAGMFNIDEQMRAGMGVGQVPSATFIFYAGIYTVIFFFWGMRRFYKKDF